jgi:hypothetical protein
MCRFTSLGIMLLTCSLFSAGALAEEFVLNFGPEEIIKAKGKEIVVPGYSVPSFEDWNNDQLKDLIVGEGGGGVTGKIRVYLNVGTEADPCFADYSYVQSNGADLTIPPAGCLGCFPRVVPWSGAGHKDLLVGLGDGTVKIFLNIGTVNEPKFDGGTTIKVGPTSSTTLSVGQRATPLLVDWDNDGLLDLVAGGLDGAIHIYRNYGVGVSLTPRFSDSPAGGVLAQANALNLLVPTGRSSPVIMDLDGDGKKDLLTGNTDGQILFYKNTGTDSLPIFADPPTQVQSNGKPIHLTGGLRSRPFLCHWTGDGTFGHKDGYWDLLVGYGDGKIRLYRGIPKQGDFNANGTLDADDFTVMAKALNKPVAAGGSPADLNKDGVVDDVDLHLFINLWLAEHGNDKI